MLYLISYNINDNSRESAFVDALKREGDTTQVLPKAYFLSSEKLESDIFKALEKWVGPSEQLIVAYADVQRLAGWVPSKSVDWLNRYKGNS
ncbi:MAG: hypothetical protein LUD17_16765 [Bacteroidales bacterium]|nr:hypothetical protein [Bacteroidales bacterium]